MVPLGTSTTTELSTTPVFPTRCTCTFGVTVEQFQVTTHALSPSGKIAPSRATGAAWMTLIPG